MSEATLLWILGAVCSVLALAVSVLIAVFWKWQDRVSKNMDDLSKLDSRVGKIEGMCAATHTTPMEPRVIKLEERSTRIDEILEEVAEVKSDIKELSRAVDRLENTLTMLRNGFGKPTTGQ